MKSFLVFKVGSFTCFFFRSKKTQSFSVEGLKFGIVSDSVPLNFDVLCGRLLSGTHSMNNRCSDGGFIILHWICNCCMEIYWGIQGVVQRFILQNNSDLTPNSMAEGDMDGS